MKYEVMAALDVGTNAIRMLVAQVNKDGKVTILDDCYKPTSLGKDTFATGRIQVASIHDLCDTLNGFHQIMKQYKVKKYRAVSTSGIREAANREYVIDNVRSFAGLDVEVLNNAQTRFYMYKAVKGLINDAKALSEKGTLMVDIGSGGIEISVYKDGNLKFTEYVKLGSLRLKEILADIEKRTLNFPEIMHEFIKSRFDYFEPIMRSMNITSFIGLGGELKLLANLSLRSKETNNTHHKNVQISDDFISSDALKKLLDKVYKMTVSQIINEFDISRNHAEILLPSILLYQCFLEMTSSKGIYMPDGSLRHGLLADMVDEWVDSPSRKEGYEDIINSVWYIGEKYSIDIVHCRYIEKLTMSIYDQLQKIHGMSDRHRIYLRVAAILHDIGKYVNVNSHDIHAYNILRYQDIMGFSDIELEIVANITRYHSMDTPKPTDENYKMLNENEQIIVSKLASILRIAEALDMSHKRKIKRIDVEVIDRKIVLEVWAVEELLLEEWNLEETVGFFEEVMGYKVVLKKRR